MMSKVQFLILIFLILLEGCNSCRSQAFRSKSKPEQKEEQALGMFALSSPILFAAFKDFSYESSLNLSLVSADRHVQNSEHVSIKGSGERLHMSKKIDDSHFFEIMNEKDEFLVKSRNNPWRSGSSNKAKYQSLIADGFNLLPWLVEQFGLENLFIKQNNSLSIKDQPLPQDAPFVALLKNPPTFSNINALIELDPSTGLLSSLSLHLTCSSGDEQRLALNASINLLKNTGISLIMPSVSPDEPLIYPVNIATRFKNLMEQRPKR